MGFLKHTIKVAIIGLVTMAVGIAIGLLGVTIGGPVGKALIITGIATAVAGGFIAGYGW